LEARGNKDGKFELTNYNPVISMYEPFSVYGRSCEINFPTKKKLGRGDATRSAAIGNFGKTGESDIPIWDTCPTPCNDD